MQYLDAISKMTEWSLFISKENHSIFLLLSFFKFFMFKFFMTILIFIFIIYYYLPKKDPIFKANFTYIFYNFCDWFCFVFIILYFSESNLYSGPIISWQIDGETVEPMADFILGGGLQNHCRWWLQPWN